jgi:hypothetical protein
MEKLDAINKMIMDNSLVLSDPGLLHGKMGVCLYFFHLSRKSEKAEHLDFAEKLLDEVYKQVNNQSIGCGFGDGLAGIAWAIKHLIQEGFVEADPDEVLEEVEDTVFRYLVSQTEFQVGLMEGLLGYLAYLVFRLEYPGVVDPDKEFVTKRLMVEVLNHIGTAIDDKKLRVNEPSFLHFMWDLPLCLLILAKAYPLNYHQKKFWRILENLSPAVLSYFPMHTANKLFLLYGMSEVLLQVDLPLWQNHVNILRQNTDLTYLVDKELKDKNLFLSNGLAGISLILRHMPQENWSYNQEKIMGKIFSSEFMVSHIGGKSENKPVIGLSRGLSGIGLAYILNLKNKLPKHATTSNILSQWF